jgi:hypothetical protein
VPRTLDFLLSRNRLNVAVSRAMCLACIVASPRLHESRARTIEQMRLITRCAVSRRWRKDKLAKSFSAVGSTLRSGPPQSS